MTSELRVDNLKGSTTGGSINVLGEGTSATTNLQQGLCKAWVNFDGTGTIATRDTQNISGLTDGGTGVYAIAYTSSLNNDDYSYQIMKAILSPPIHKVDPENLSVHIT